MESSFSGYNNAVHGLGTGVVVMCPTRELSMQTYGVLRSLADRHSLTHGLIIGGANRKAEARNLQKGNWTFLFGFFVEYLTGRCIG